MALRRPKQYETLRRIRRRQEEMQANLLAIAERKTLAALDALRALETAQDSALESAGTGDPFQGSRYIAYQRHLQGRAVEQHRTIEQLRGQANLRRRELQNAIKQRRMIDRLIQRAEQEIEAWRLKQEQLNLDEVATTRAARARAHGGPR